MADPDVGSTMATEANTEESGYSSSSDGADTEDDAEEVKLSDTLVMFPQRKLANHENVVAGEIRNVLEDGNSHARAIKFDRDPDMIFKEAKMLQTLGAHRNVVCFYSADTFHDDFSYLVLEKCHDLNLQSYILSLDTIPVYDMDRGLKFCQQLITGLKYVHEKLIIHKDLKPVNILLNHYLEIVKIADFGSSQHVKSSTSKVRCPNIFGTLGYRPPESLDRSYVSLKSDIFSLGVVFCFMLSNGKSPFGPQSDKWDHNTQNGEIVIPDLLVPNPVPTKHLIKAMLERDRCRRPSIHKIERHHCWSFDIDFTYPSEEEFEDREVFQEVTPEEGSYRPTSEFLRALEPMEARLRITSESECESIFEIIWDCCDDLLSDEAKRLSETLIDAVAKLMEGRADEGSKDVKSKIPDKLSPDNVNAIGEKLGEEHPVFAIILHHVAGCIYTSQNVQPQEAVDTIKWFSDRVADMSRVAQHFMLPDSTIEFNSTMLNACLNFMKNLLYNLRAVKHVEVKKRSKHEVRCILKISRTSLLATERLKVAPNSDVIKICYEGLESLKAAGNLTKHHCYLLNNIGEAYLQLGQLSDAQMFLNKAWKVVTEASTFKLSGPKIPRLDTNVQPQDAEQIQTNFNKLELLRSMRSCCGRMTSDDKYRLSATLVNASEQLTPGKANEVIKDVNSKTLSADIVNVIAKDLDEAHPLCAIIMHRLAGALYVPDTRKPKEAVDWFGDRIADISCVAQEVCKSDNRDSSNAKLVRISIEFMEELLLELRAVKHDGKNNDIAIREVGCVLSISRIRLNAVAFEIPLKQGSVAMCKDALQVLESDASLTKHKYRGYLLNNIGETYMQLGKFIDAKRYLNKALRVKKAFAYRAIENKNRDISITENNLRKLKLLEEEQ